jgi:hypothetical protein
MKRVHLDIGDSKIACQFAPPRATYLRTTAYGDVTCECCKSYTLGHRPIGDFCAATLAKHRRATEPQEPPQR